MITVQGAGALEKIRTDRLTIRRFDAADGDALHGYLSQPEAVRFEPYGVQSRLQCHELAFDREGDEAFWAVCRTDDDRLVGNLYLHRDDPHTYTLGYVFDPAQWGQGYATEAASALLDVCFRSWGAHRVTAGCSPDNTRSWRLLERLGFTRVASSTTSFQYAMLATEWVARSRT